MDHLSSGSPAHYVNTKATAEVALPVAQAASGRSPSKRRLPWRWIILSVIPLVIVIASVPFVRDALSTVSTDDAYVNGHVTMVAPRVAGQVARVLVEDNNRVRKGDLLLQLDSEPFQVQVNIARAAVAEAEANLDSVKAQTRAVEGRARSLRFALQHAIEDVDNQVSLLHARVASLESRRAIRENAQNEYDRLLGLYNTSSAAKQELDDRTEALRVANAQYDETLQSIYQVRVSLGLPRKPESGNDLTQVPNDLDQTFSSVRQAQASLIEAVAQLGIMDSLNKSPKQMVADFYKRDPEGDIDRIFDKLLQDAPAVKQADSKVVSARRTLDEVSLNLRYCDVISEIDGVVTRREVNPGNNVVAGQALMAVRSLTEIWVDANFKETQLGRLRIGQAVDLDVDMYGSRRVIKGRISGFTMGTGSTLSLLPAENATGNFVKVVQRLPVRIELLDYDPDKAPLFIGLSVAPRVRIEEPASGPDAGRFLQQYMLPPATSPANASEVAR